MNLSRRLSAPLAALFILFVGCSEDSSPATASDAGETESDDDLPTADDDDLADDDAPAQTDDDGGEHDEDAGSLPDPHAIPEDAGTGVLECALLASECHPYARGRGDLGDTCHQIGHEGEPQACLEAFDGCMAFCSPDAGGVPHAPRDGGAPLCEQMGHVCHELGEAPDAGFAAECHEVGHAGDEAACAAIYDDCVALCGGHHADHDAGAGEDAGHGQEAPDSGVDPVDAALDASAADAG